MKLNFNLFNLFFFLLILTSCGNEQDVVKPDESHRDLAVEILNHMTIVEQTEDLNVAKHSDFISEELLQAYASSPGFVQKVRSAENQESDTLFTYEEIPLIRETETKTLIFSNGKSESYIEDLTPYDVNPANLLTETPVSDSARISKTIIKNGILSVFNKSGRLISSEEYPETDYTAFLDTIKIYLAKSLINAQQNVNRAAKVLALKRSLPDGSIFKELPNGNVIYEVLLNPGNNNNQGLSRTSGNLRGRTELDPELNRTLSFELFQGDNLIQRKVFSYGSNQKLNCFFNNQVITQNPELIESQTLIINSRGLPAIRHSREFYSQNQTSYYLKN